VVVPVHPGLGDDSLPIPYLLQLALILSTSCGWRLIPVGNPSPGGTARYYQSVLLGTTSTTYYHRVQPGTTRFYPVLPGGTARYYQSVLLGTTSTTGRLSATTTSTTSLLHLTVDWTDKLMSGGCPVVARHPGGCWLFLKYSPVVLHPMDALRQSSTTSSLGPVHRYSPKYPALAGANVQHPY
jgi:hypothetical protein